MDKIIETNLSFHENEDICDFQSRIVEVESWELYVEEMIARKSVRRSAYVGSMAGESLPRDIEVEHFKSDKHHLSVDFINKAGHKMKHMAYLIK